jgi:hypothetical protein
MDAIAHLDALKGSTAAKEHEDKVQLRMEEYMKPHRSSFRNGSLSQLGPMDEHFACWNQRTNHLLTTIGSLGFCRSGEANL